jgi:hypothetical protein
MASMPDRRRDDLARTLAVLDRLVAESSGVANDVHDDCRQSANDFLIEVQEVRQYVEAELRGE